MRGPKRNFEACLPSNVTAESSVYNKQTTLTNVFETENNRDRLLFGNSDLLQPQNSNYDSQSHKSWFDSHFHC